MSISYEVTDKYSFPPEKEVHISDDNQVVALSDLVALSASEFPDKDVVLVVHDWCCNKDGVLAILRERHADDPVDK